MSTTAIPTLPVSGESGPLLTAEEFCLRYENLRAELVKGKLPRLRRRFRVSTTVTPAQPTPDESVPLLTAEQFCQRYENQRVELILGEVVEIPMPFARPGKICATLSRLIGNHVADNDLGHDTSNDTFVKTRSNPDSVRGGDVCFWSYERQPRGRLPAGLLALSPDLIVEVRSPTNEWADIFAKIAEYLKAKVSVVVIVDPEGETVSVYRPKEFQQIFHNGDELILPDVLPGFALRIQKLFE